MQQCCFEWSSSVVEMGQGTSLSWDKWTCANAAENGHLELLKWVRAINVHGIKTRVPMLLGMATLKC